MSRENLFPHSVSVRMLNIATFELFVSEPPSDDGRKRNYFHRARFGSRNTARFLGEGPLREPVGSSGRAGMYASPRCSAMHRRIQENNEAVLM